MSSSDHNRHSVPGVMSELGWISTCSVDTTAQPPSAFTPRIAAMLDGKVRPMPLQCGTW